MRSIRSARASSCVGGNKQGVNEAKFYEALIRVADDRFDRHLARLKR